MIVVWSVALVLGLTVATMASRRAVVAALTAGTVSKFSLGAIGASVMAIGTDLPEIANSITAALSGHGDLLVGDTSGSAMTQVTLVMGILLFAAASIRSERHDVGILGGLTAAALVLDAWLVSDGVLSRWEGLILVLLWVAGLVILERSRGDPPKVATADTRSALPHALRSIGWLAVVGAAATVVVRSFVEITEQVGVPELVASAIVLSLGTSLPELVVDWTAIRRGAVALALGDLFGSSLLDATLAVGIGPMLRAVTVSDGAFAACLIAAAGVAGATIVMISRREHGRPSAFALFAIYGAAVAALIVTVGVE